MNRNMRGLAFKGLSFLDTLAAEHGDLIELSPPPMAHLLVSNPEATGQIFRSDRHMRMDGSDTLRPLVGEHSLLFANGARHAAYREVVGPALRGRSLRAYRSTITEAVAEATDLTPGTILDLPAWTRGITLRIIGKIVLGTSDDDLLSPFTHWVEGAIGSPRQMVLYRFLRVHTAIPSPWRTFLRRREKIDRDVLACARAASDGATMAELLMRGDEPLGHLDDGELRDQLVSLLFAGHETTASATAWTLYWLERDASIRADLRDELAATSSDGFDAKEVPLLDAVCRESLRISPPATLAGNRVLADDAELCGRPLEAGARLTPCIYLAHRRPDVYPEPGRFDPGRFLGTRMSAQEYLPFGGGVRRCLGADLAMVELRMIVAAVLRRMDLHCLNPERGTPHRRGPAMGPHPELRMEVRACPS